MSSEYLKQFNTGVAALTKPKAPKAGSTALPKGTVTSGSLKLSPTDISGGEQKLEGSRGADNFVDPGVYKAMYDKFIKGGGQAAGFVKVYPPKNYINPANTTLPTFLRPPAPAKGKSTGGASSGRSLN